jgi:hypothetical protein
VECSRGRRVHSRHEAPGRELRNEALGYRMMAIQDLEEARAEALEQTISVQAARKEKFDAKLPWDHGVRTGGLVLLYDNRHERFPGKLHTRWMGPYRVTEVFENGSLQLEDLQGNWLGTRVNGSRVKQYLPEVSTEEEEDTPSEEEPAPGMT